MSFLLETILEAPNAQLVIQQAQKALEAEKKQRLAFYEWITPDIKAEFINGEIVIHSPAKRGHLDATIYLSELIDIYARLHKLGITSTEKALVTLTRNDYEPDICFWGNEKIKDFTKDTLLHPAPDFVVEILSKSTQARDRGIKFQDYAAHGVQEYWLIDYKKETVEQYILEDAAFELRQKVGVGNFVESVVLSGFKIPVLAIFDHETQLEVLRQLFTSL